MITWMKSIISKLFNEVLNLGTNMKAQFFNWEGLNRITIDRLAELDRNRTGPDKPGASSFELVQARYPNRGHGDSRLFRQMKGEPFNHPTLHRPFELAHGFHFPYKSGDVGLERGMSNRLEWLHIIGQLFSNSTFSRLSDLTLMNRILNRNRRLFLI